MTDDNKGARFVELVNELVGAQTAAKLVDEVLAQVKPEVRAEMVAELAAKTEAAVSLQLKNYTGGGNYNFNGDVERAVKDQFERLVREMFAAQLETAKEVVQKYFDEHLKTMIGHAAREQVNDMVRKIRWSI